MVKNKLRQLLLIGLFFMLMGCTHQNAQMSHLQHLDSLMEKHTQEVYDTLCLMKPHVEKDNVREVMMKYRILMAKAQNKLYLQMPSDSAFQEVVDYYEKKGTSNERMEANYLLGCIYRDQKEAPMAMQYYQKAVECADTLRKDCDYVTLFSIYGQMSDIFVKQNLYKEAMWAEGQYSKYAYKAGDIYNSILGKELLIPIYYSMGDTARMISQTKKCYYLYKKSHYVQKAASVFPTLISFYLKNKQLEKARYYMKIYEKETGLMNCDGSIAPHYEYYYNIKGRYFLEINKLDSAEIFFRKLGAFGYLYEADRGLLALYISKQNKDSINKYAKLCEKEMDNILVGNQTKAVKQAASMYNYHRMQKKYTESILKKERLENRILFLMLIFLGFLSILMRIYKKYKKKLKSQQKEINEKQHELEKWNDCYLEAVKEMELLKEELRFQETSKNSVIERKQIKIKMLSEEIHELREIRNKMSLSEKCIMLDNDETYRSFKEMASAKLNVPHPQTNDWNKLQLLVHQNFPLFYEKISSLEKLSQLEKRVCLLTRLRFSNGEMVVLLNSSPSSISNAKQKINQRLFGGTSATTLLKNMLNM